MLDHHAFTILRRYADCYTGFVRGDAHAIKVADAAGEGIVAWLATHLHDTLDETNLGNALPTDFWQRLMGGDPFPWETEAHTPTLLAWRARLHAWAPRATEVPWLLPLEDPALYEAALAFGFPIATMLTPLDAAKLHLLHPHAKEAQTAYRTHRPRKHPVSFLIVEKSFYPPEAPLSEHTLSLIQSYVDGLVHNERSFTFEERSGLDNTARNMDERFLLLFLQHETMGRGLSGFLSTHPAADAWLLPKGSAHDRLRSAQACQAFRQRIHALVRGTRTEAAEALSALRASLRPAHTAKAA